MPRRYTQEELDTVKRDTDLVALIQSRGIQLTRHGSKDLKGLCPFHDDRNPSLIVTPARNLWNCPACGKGGDVIKFVELHDGVSFRHAVELLRNGHVIGSGDVVKKTTVPRLEAPVELNADDQLQLIRVIDYYHQRLLDTQPAQDYLKKRGIADPEAIKTFKLGYADRTLGLRLPQKNRKTGRALRDQLEKIGLYRKTGREHLNGCLIIPVIGSDGAITEVYGRKLNDNSSKGYANHLYLPGPHRGVWNPACLNGSREVILCESLIDALTFWCCGLRNVTASYGTGGFTSDHLAAFIDHRVETVFIAYDRDDAGDTAAATLAAKLAAEGICSRRVQFPRGMDANSFALSVSPPERSLKLLVDSAAWMDEEMRGAASRSGRESAPPCTPHATDDFPSASQPENSPVEAPKVAESAPAPQADPPAGDLAESARTPASMRVQGPLAPGAEREGAQPSQSRTGKVNVPCRFEGEDIFLTLGEREYRVRGLARNTSFDLLKVNVRLSAGDAFYVDTLDLYNARHRKAFLHAAADECRVEPDVIRRDVGRILLKLEELQENNLSEATEPEKPAAVKLDRDETAEAMELLRSPQLLDRIAADVELAGLVGEGANALVAYLAGVSRLTDDPLAIIIQSSSSAGKSSVMDAVLSLMPDEDQVRYTAMTGQSLFYMGETQLSHKILAISEEEGAEQASYALKTLQSEKKLRIASTGKDPKSGRLVTQEYVVEGPCVIFMTTTNIEIDEELQNRCIVLTVNEDRDQTRRIHDLQRSARTLEGLLRQEQKKATLRVHRNAQRLLKPLLVVNPYAEKLTFADGRLRTRRDHMKYLNLINAVALLHQYQREVKTVTHRGKRLQYIEATLADIEAANGLAAAVMGTSLDDLPPQTRKLLMALHALADERCEARDIDLADLRLTRREIREAVGWSDTQLRVHLLRLVELEYVAFHRAGPGGRFHYELLYRGEGQDGRRFVMNLADVETLRTPQDSDAHDYDGEVAGANAEVAPHSRGECGQVAAPPKSAKSADLASKSAPDSPEVADSAQNHVAGPSLAAHRSRSHTAPQADPPADGSAVTAEPVASMRGTQSESPNDPAKQGLQAAQQPGASLVPGGGVGAAPPHKELAVS